MVEISDKKYWKSMGYYDGLLYCSLLDIDGKYNWRMIRDYEEQEILGIKERISHWYFNDNEKYKCDLLEDIHLVIPVRDY